MTTLVMPVAGLGLRFAREGWTRPKPMLPLDGRSFVEWALLSAIRALSPSRVVFVARPEHLDAGLRELLLSASPGCLIVASQGPPAGAAGDAMKAVPHAPQGEPLAVNDCDHAFVLRRPLARALPGEGEGVALIGFPSQNPAHSFAVLSGGQGRVARLVEKRVVGPMAVGGCYLFSSARLFARAADAARASLAHGEELYVSAAVNSAISLGARCAMEPAIAYAPFGTPSEFAALRPGQVGEMMG